MLRGVDIQSLKETSTASLRRWSVVCCLSDVQSTLIMCKCFRSPGLLHRRSHIDWNVMLDHVISLHSYNNSKDGKPSHGNLSTSTLFSLDIKVKHPYYIIF